MELAGKDHVDFILELWRKQKPGLDCSPMGSIGRYSRLYKYLEKALSANFTRFGLNSGEFDVLATLYRSGPPYALAPTHLYKALMLTSGTMTNRLDRLEERALIQRFPDPDDRRGITVKLTSQGQALVDKTLPAHLEMERQLLGGLSGSEQRQFQTLLKKLLLSLGDSYRL